MNRSPNISMSVANNSHGFAFTIISDSSYTKNIERKECPVWSRDRYIIYFMLKRGNLLLLVKKNDYHNSVV